jgi:carbonic anhydrase
MPQARMSGPEALAHLRAGNQRYAQGLRSIDSLISHNRRDLAVQAPIAIILGCSDSRAPAEIVFDCGLGDLFVIRVAGNIVAPSQIGSVEFAAAKFGTRLVVVMGHERCGAITATLDAITGAAPESANLRAIVERVRPGIEGLVSTELGLDRARLEREAVRANVRASLVDLRRGSEILERMASEDGLLIVGAELDLESGRVDFFD